MRTGRQTAYDAVVAGYLGLDLAPGFSPARAARPLADLLRPGKLVEVQGLSIALGGVVANTGLAMQRFGRRVALCGLVGRDALGDLAIGLLRARGMSSGIRRCGRAGTAYGIVLAPPGTDRIFLEDPGCNGVFSAVDIDYAIVRRSRLFHFGYPTLMARMSAGGGRELRALFARVHDAGVATSLDMTLPDPDGPAGQADWRRILAATLPHVDIFTPSIEEILCMLEPAAYAGLLAGARGGDILDAVPEDLYDRLGDRILALGVKVLMIKAGHRGAYLRTGDIDGLNAATSLRLPAGNWSRRRVWAAPFRVAASRMRNACGAGDCAVAAFLTAILNGDRLERAGRYAMLAGRDNLYGVDALSGLKDWKRLTNSRERVLALRVPRRAARAARPGRRGREDRA
jgi:sugar/nucleoside kinase (ribokinase family)